MDSNTYYKQVLLELHREVWYDDQAQRGQAKECENRHESPCAHCTDFMEAQQDGPESRREN